MNAIYVDASAVLRLLLEHKGLRAPFHRTDVVVSSELVEVETHQHLERLRLTRRLDVQTFKTKHEELNRLLASFHLFPLDRSMLELARASFQVPVLILHALHVGTAQVLSGETGGLHFWTHVPEQAAVAALRGLEVRGVEPRT